MKSRHLATSLTLIAALVVALPAAAAAETPDTPAGGELLDRVSSLFERVTEWVQRAAALIGGFTAQEGASMSTNG